MVKVVPPAYPEALSVKFWNKAKGLLARITSVKTGITERLEKSKAIFDKVPWDDLEATAFVTKYGKGQGSKNRGWYEDMLRQYLEKNHPRFKALEAEFYDLHSFLKSKANEFAQDDKTKSFAKPLLAMADAANKFTYAVAFGTVSAANQQVFAVWMKEADEIMKGFAEARGKIKTVIEKAEVEITKAKKKTPTASDYVSMWSQHLRGIGAMIAMAGKGDPTVRESFAEPLKMAAKHWSQGGLPKDDPDVAMQVKQDIVIIGKFKDACTVL